MPTGMRGGGPVAEPKVAAPAGKPVPVLQQAGFPGSIEDFNHRVQAVVDAHTSAYGIAPSPALVVAVARNAEPHEYGKLFQLRSHQHAQSVKALGQFQPTDPTTELVKAIGNVTTKDQLDAFFATENEHLVEQALDDPASKKAFLRAYTTAKNRVNARAVDPTRRGQALVEAGIPVSTGFLHDALGTLALAGEQVSTALVLGPPTLVIAEGRAIGKSVGEKSFDPLVATNKKLAKGLVEGVKRDFTHPGENPGYLFLDVLGIASLGGGTFLRAARANAAVLERGGTLTGVKVAARRGAGGTAVLNKSGYTEEQLLTENPLLNWAQQKLVDWRNTRMAARATPDPGGATALFGAERLQSFLDLALDPVKANFSSENKLGREARARRRIETQIQMTLKRDLDMVAGWSQTASSAVQRVNQRLPNRLRSLTVGEQKAIQALALDDPTPIETWRAFHENMIDLDVGDVAAHRAQLAALKLADEALKNPRPRFQQALELVHEVVAEQERIKNDELGLKVDTAERRVIGEGAFVRQAAGAQTAAEVAAIPKPGELGGGVTPPDLATAHLVFHGVREDIAKEHVGVGKIRSRNGKPIYFAEDPRYAAGHSGDKRLGEARARTGSVDSGQVFVLRGADVGSKRGDVIGSYSGTDVPFLGVVPSPVALKGRDAVLAYLRAHPPDAPRQSETSHYLPVARKGKPRKGVSEKLELMSPQRGKYGVPEPALPSSLRHEYTGKALIAGDFRFDATALASNEYAQTVRAASKLNEWRKLRDHGVQNPPDLRWYTPVRKGSAVDERLRDIMDRALDAELNHDDALHLSSLEAQDLQRYLYPAEYKNGQWHLLPDVAKDDVTWVDVRQLDRYRPPGPSGMKTFFQVANEPFRDITLLYRLAYGLNAVGNVGMGLVHQGVLVPPNLLRSIKAERFYGAKVDRSLDTLAGTSRSQSYAPTGIGEGIAKTLTTPGRVAARAWNVVTDQHFRRAAIIHELRRQAHKLGMDPDAPETMNALLFDEKYVSNRNEAVRRGGKAMVEFDNQTWFEREYLRHFIFVYPWVSRSFVWNLRTIVEHPTQVAVFDQIGRQAEEEFPDILKRVPDWFKHVGYVPVGFNDDGTPKIVNASSVNTFSSLSQLLYPVASGFTNVKYASLSDMLGPAAKFAVHGVTGKDDFGNDYPNGAWRGAALEALTALPQLRPSQRKTNEPLPPVDVSDRATLIHRLNASLKQTVFTPGWLDGYGALITGGLTPKSPTEPDSLLARWYRDASLAERHKLEVDLINRATKLQGELLDQPVPRSVSGAIGLSSQRELAYKVFAQENGRTPTDKERILSDITVLHAKGRIPDADAKALTKKAGKFTDPVEMDRFRAGLLDKYADAKVLREWDSDVRFVWSFRPEVVKGKLALLRSEGLGSAKVPADQETLFAWGRQALAYRREARLRAREIQAAQGTSDVPLLEAELRVWTDAHDKPIVVGPTGKPRYTVGTPTGLVKAGNIDINHRPVAQNADGAISTVRSLSINVDGREVLIPTVVGGKVVSNAAAIAEYRRTGKNLGAFASVAAANRYAEALHKEQATAYHALPSPVRMEWANTTPQDRAAHVASLAKAGWGSLTNFDKELLGRKVPASTSAAWAEVARAKAQYVDANPGAKIHADQLLGLAKAIDKDPRYTGFLKDYLFARQPRIARFEASTVYRKMPDTLRSDFDKTVGNDAKAAAAALKSGNYNNGEVRAAWRKYIEEDVMPNLKPDLKQFLDPYGVSFLTGLVSR